MSKKGMLGGLVERLVDVSDEMLGMLDDLLTKTLNPEWFSEFKRFLRKEPCWTESAVKLYLRRLFETETLIVPETSEEETFSSSGLFPGGVYGLTPQKSTPRPATEAAVHEQVVDGRFAQVFGSLGKDRRVWTEAQVCAFVRTHPAKLRGEGYDETFFELEGGFVAIVVFDVGGRLRVRVDEFSDDCVWHVEYRHCFVSLQLAA
ncbi:MAG: hypothetical protein WD963_01025 [Candidatus Paceibacterota bacterium]